MPKGPATQKFLEVKEIKDDVIIIKNGALRAVLMASSINLALKSEQEQEAVIYQYQNFLNSLDFTAQFLIQSRKINIDEYLNELKKLGEFQENELLKIQTTEYIDFIKTFTEMQNIMSKTFYIIVPFAAAEKIQEGVLDKILGIFQKKPVSEQSEAEEKFIQNKIQLTHRVENVKSGLLSLGIKSEMLKNEELTELFFRLYNPGEEEKKFTKKS